MRASGIAISTPVFGLPHKKTPPRRRGFCVRYVLMCSLYCVLWLKPLPGRVEKQTEDRKMRELNAACSNSLFHVAFKLRAFKNIFSVSRNISRGRCESHIADYNAAEA